MKKCCLILILLPVIMHAQNHLPSYPTVLKQFFFNYSFVQTEPYYGLEFAKKKDGWHVHIMDQKEEEIIESQLFWSSAEGKFNDLLHFGERGTKEEARKEIDKRLQTGFYGYERSPYYGYPGWDIDVINDFGNVDHSRLADTLLDALGRAYSAYASRYFWYQYGGKLKTADSLLQSLKPGQLPSRRRADSAKIYINKAIGCFDMLSKKNNAYISSIGNAGMKRFNEQVHGYLQMSLAGFDDMAKEFLEAISANPTVTKLARNYLNSCEPNGILITYGDNDTYPLLYVQEKENFRKDITVLNISLLGLPAYLEMIKRKKMVTFNTSSERYKEPGFSYALFREDNKAGRESLPLSDFLKVIQNKTYKFDPYGDTTIAAYPVKKITLTVDLEKFKQVSKQNSLARQITIEISPVYLLSDDFLILDIIHTNLYRRPVYFSHADGMYLDHVQQEGLVYRFLPLTKNKSASDLASFKKTEVYINNLFQPVLSRDISTGIAPDSGNDGNIYTVYLNQIKYHVDLNEIQKAKTWIKKLFEVFDNSLAFHRDLVDLGFLMIQADDEKGGLKVLEDYMEEMVRIFKSPKATDRYTPKEWILFTGNEIIKKLDELKAPKEKIEHIIAQVENEN